MIKTLAIYLLVFGLLFGNGCYLHLYWLGDTANSIGFSVTKVYVFHALFSFLLCGVFYVLSKSKKWTTQLGFLYMGALVFKVVFFSVLFSSVLFFQEVLSTEARISLLIPVFLFLVPEVYFIVKILTKLDATNK